MLAQSGNQTDIFWKFYSPADTLWLPKTVGRGLGYTTANATKIMSIGYTVPETWHVMDVIAGLKISTQHWTKSDVKTAMSDAKSHYT